MKTVSASSYPIMLLSWLWSIYLCLFRKSSVLCLITRTNSFAQWSKALFVFPPLSTKLHLECNHFRSVSERSTRFDLSLQTTRTSDMRCRQRHKCQWFNMKFFVTINEVLKLCLHFSWLNHFLSWAKLFKMSTEDCNKFCCLILTRDMGHIFWHSFAHEFESPCPVFWQGRCSGSVKSLCAKTFLIHVTQTLERFFNCSAYLFPSSEGLGTVSG